MATSTWFSVHTSRTSSAAGLELSRMHFPAEVCWRTCLRLRRRCCLVLTMYLVFRNRFLSWSLLVSLNCIGSMILSHDCLIVDEQCLLRLFSTGRTDSASWYTIWQAAEATFARCARDRRSGNFRGLGRFPAVLCDAVGADCLW